MLRPHESNPQAASAIPWVVQAEPTALYDKTCAAGFTAVPRALDDEVCDGADPGDRAIVVSLGNPVLWVTASIAGAVLVVRAVRRRDTTAALVVALGLVQWLPWTVAGRQAFSFYAVPIVPVLAWWIVMAAAPWRRRDRVVGAVVLSVVIAFAMLRPILTAEPLGRERVGQSLWYPSWP